MTITTKYDIGQRIIAKSPKRDKAETFTIAEIRVSAQRYANLNNEIGLIIEYRSISLDPATDRRLGTTGSTRMGNWYPEIWVLGLA